MLVTFRIRPGEATGAHPGWRQGFLRQTKALATYWQMVCANVWGGKTDPATEHLYQTFGLIALGFGLFVVGGAFWRCLSEAKRSYGLIKEIEALRPGVRHSLPQRTGFVCAESA
jgi:hypothetical protein